MQALYYSQSYNEAQEYFLGTRIPRSTTISMSAELGTFSKIRKAFIRQDQSNTLQPDLSQGDFNNNSNS